MATDRCNDLNGRLIGETAERMDLKAALLYETVIELADEGLLTARCINAAAGILLTSLGLPRYYFRNISPEALKDVLRAIATNLAADASGRYVLSTDAVFLRAEVGEGQQILVCTEDNLEAMEGVTGEAVARRRWEYYFCDSSHCYTYIIKPGECPAPGAATSMRERFAFASERTRFTVPAETSRRYERFLSTHQKAVIRPIVFSTCRDTGETRIMFHKTISHLYLPTIRKLFRTFGLTLTRAYGEPYRTEREGVALICSLYVRGEVKASLRTEIKARLRELFALLDNTFFELYLNDVLSFSEAVFTANLRAFIHEFIYRDLDSDRQIMASLESADLRSALAKRIHDANRSEFTRRLVTEILRDNPGMVKELYALFCLRFSPAVRAAERDAKTIEARLTKLNREIDMRLSDDMTAREVLRFAVRLVTHVVKTNFFKRDKRAFAFRIDAAVLDPLVFPVDVHGLFFVLGHYAIGTHMRSDEIARGGLRLLRTTPANYENQLDEATLLNYALGPRAQRMKHKDIAEGGAKGVIVPTPEHARDALQAVYDYADGVLDVILPSKEVVDHLGHPEMIFFGPDEGTAQVMDDVAALARDRGYVYWRTFTTGKSSGLPHDAYGRTVSDRVFALNEHHEKGTELQIEGERVALSKDPADLIAALGEGIASSGMTTSGVMSAFRTLIARFGEAESELPLMMTGGPDGDLGANQIQCYQGPICLIVDSGGVLFDPQGLNREALLKMSFSRHSAPRLNSATYPKELLSAEGFMVRGSDRNVRLPDGTVIEDGGYFHRTFLTSPDSRKLIEKAKIQAFIPCGGFKDTVNFQNVDVFLDVFRDLRYIVEGANVFFDDAARDHIAASGRILQIKDSTANKGGVMSSSLAEVLSAFLLGERYEAELVDNAPQRFRLARELMNTIRDAVSAEVTMLLDLYESLERKVPLWRLSTRTSEWLLSLQQEVIGVLPGVLADEALVTAILEAYIPPVLVDVVGRDRLAETLATTDLQQYRNAILSKKLAALGLYRCASCWQAFLEVFRAEPLAVVRALVDGTPIAGLDDRDK